MAKLNEYNDKTKGNIHLMVTTLCDRDCKYCCNKQYDLNDIPQVTDEELKNCHTVYITGGEPFLFSNPNAIAEELKKKYPNIKAVRVYTNALALWTYLTNGGRLDNIDGLSVSIKNITDRSFFDLLLSDSMLFGNIKEHCKSNVLYVFNLHTPAFEPLMPVQFKWYGADKVFKVVSREWQEDFVPEPTSIFRRI